MQVCKSTTQSFRTKTNVKKCKVELIFVTAFLIKEKYIKGAAKIAWETEVWIANNPDHLIHFNGHKFLDA
jgi:type II restriction enzyme